MIEAQCLGARLVNAQDVGYVRIRHLGSRVRVVGRVDNDVVDAKASHAAAGAMDGPGRLDVRRQGGEFVGHDAHLPGVAAVGRKPHDLGRSFAFVARTEGTSFHQPRQDLGGRLLANSSGRLARSVAMMTHSLVK
jgi:hypothetical protein